MFKTLSLILVVFCIEGALSQAIIAGKCPNIPPLENVDLDEVFNGHYYADASFPERSTVLNNTRCTQTRLSKLLNIITVKAFGIDQTTNEEKKTTIEALDFGKGAVLANIIPLVSGKLANTWVLAAEPGKYASVFVCGNLSKTLSVWFAVFFVNDLNLSEEVKNKGYEAFHQVGLYRNAFTPYDQKNCPVF